MTLKIYKDGTDQYILTRLGGIDPDTGAQSILFGGFEGDSLDIDNLIIIWSEYKKDDESIDNPVVVWNSTAGMWKIIIPEEYITQYGSSWLNLSGTGLIPVAFEIEIVDLITRSAILEECTDAVATFDSVVITLTSEAIIEATATAISNYDTATPFAKTSDLDTLAKTSDLSTLSTLTSDDITLATGVALTESTFLRVIDILMSGTFTKTSIDSGTWKCVYTGTTDSSTIEYIIDSNGQRTGTTISLV